MGEEDAISARRWIDATKRRQSRSHVGLPPGLGLGCLVVLLAGNESQRLVAVAATRGHRLGDRVDGSDPAG
jgi:hypothetical protein